MYWGCDRGFGPPSGLKVPGQVTPGGLVVVADYPAESLNRSSQACCRSHPSAAAAW